jgi:hypothetical protein
MVRSSVAAFYALEEWAFYLFTGPVRHSGLLALFLAVRVHPEVEKIVHRMPEILFAAVIAFCSLDRGMAE